MLVFNVGDSVECIDNDGMLHAPEVLLKAPHVYVINAVGMDGFVKVDNIDYWFLTDRFEKFAEENE